MKFGDFSGNFYWIIGIHISCKFWLTLKKNDEFGDFNNGIFLGSAKVFKMEASAFMIPHPSKADRGLIDLLSP